MPSDLNAAALAVAFGCVLLWALFSGVLEKIGVTAPIALVLLGLASSHGPLAVVHLALHSTSMRALTEATLALVLFVDASRVDLASLRKEVGVPARLLALGLPLTIVAGTGAALVLFPGDGIWIAALVASIVAPTDAALGASLLDDDRIPESVREALNLESGLNDGIATPFVNFFLAGALSAEAMPTHGVARAAADLAGGVALGAGVGLVGGALIVLARRYGWTSPGLRAIAVFALAVVAYSAALLVGVNGFVSAFAAGLAMGVVVRDHRVVDFAAEGGRLLSWLVWFAFGAAILVPGLEDSGWREVTFAVFALTAGRMLPVAAALATAKLGRATVLFIGWFGPRGLASVVFGLIASDALRPTASSTVTGAVTTTVLLSVLAHGATASPLARRYAGALRWQQRPVPG